MSARADQKQTTPIEAGAKARSPYARGDFWLDQRRDGRSLNWMIAWYDPDMRTNRYRSTRTADLRKAKMRLAAFALSGEAPEINARKNSAARRAATTVYFIGGDIGAIKIGSAFDVTSRLITLQCGSPIPLRVLAEADGGTIAERAYHKRFSAHRLHGEWFARHPDILAEIERLNAPHPRASARRGHGGEGVKERDGGR